jgi:hypothetical protein
LGAIACQSLPLFAFAVFSSCLLAAQVRNRHPAGQALKAAARKSARHDPVNRKMGKSTRIQAVARLW